MNPNNNGSNDSNSDIKSDDDDIKSDDDITQMVLNEYNEMSYKPKIYKPICNVSIRDNQTGFEAIHLASWQNKNGNIIKLLLKHGSNINSQIIENGDSCLHRCLTGWTIPRENKIGKIKTLLINDINPFLKNNHNEYPYDKATKYSGGITRNQMRIISFMIQSSMENHINGKKTMFS